jgi:LPXTG-motif cell wall-anchored protein
MFYLTVFVVPAIYVLVLGLLDWLITGALWQEWLIDLGWDCHVLAWGGLGGVFAAPNVKKLFPEDGEAAAVELAFAGALLLLSVCLLFLRKKKPPVGWKAFVSLATGGATPAVPIEIALHAHM